MTKKEVYKRTAEMWGWLAETGSGEKTAWPEWAYNGGIYASVMFACFACEDALGDIDIRDRNDNTPCNGCLLLGLWGDMTDTKIRPCVQSNSPYGKWIKSVDIDDRRKYARIIADFAEKKYKECK